MSDRVQDGSTVVLEGVCKQYGRGPSAVTALTDVSLSVRSGEFLAVMGPSGSGKTTLLNLIAGVDTPTSGRVIVAGNDFRDLSDDARSDLRLQHIGFVFQGFNLFPHFSALENVTWPLEFLGVAWRAAQQRAAVALERVGVLDGAHLRRPSELSGGEQQRVAIARALVTAPRLFLADEPTGNLDSVTAMAVLSLLHDLNAERELTVVLVTHNAAAARFARRIVDLRDGRIVQGGASTPTFS